MYTYIYLYINIYIYIHIHVYIYVRIHVHTNVYHTLICTQITDIQTVRLNTLSNVTPTKPSFVAHMCKS